MSLRLPLGFYQKTTESHQELKRIQAIGRLPKDHVTNLPFEICQDCKKNTSEDCIKKIYRIGKSPSLGNYVDVYHYECPCSLAAKQTLAIQETKTEPALLPPHAPPTPPPSKLDQLRSYISNTNTNESDLIASLLAEHVTHTADYPKAQKLLIHLLREAHRTYNDNPWVLNPGKDKAMAIITALDFLLESAMQKKQDIYLTLKTACLQKSTATTNEGEPQTSLYDAIRIKRNPCRGFFAPDSEDNIITVIYSIELTTPEILRGRFGWPSIVPYWRGRSTR